MGGFGCYGRVARDLSLALEMVPELMRAHEARWHVQET